MHAIRPQSAYPLFICGLPRSGTSFLFAVLSTHPAFANDNFKDKELRYFEKILGNRPWGGIDGVSQKKFAGIDEHIMPDIVRTLHDRLKYLRGGPDGHYLNANPRDIFYSEIICAAVPEAKFLITLRDPLTNVWSALNYPTHSWGKRDESSGFFREDDIRRTAEHWNKVAAHVLRFKLHARPHSCFILEQEVLAMASVQLHKSLENFLELRGIEELLGTRSETIIHSSFIDNTGGVGHDRRFSNIRDKIAHFQNVQRMFAENGRYVSMILEICGTFVRQLADIGLMQHGPSLRLLDSHAPLVERTESPDFHDKLYAFTAAYLLRRLVSGRDRILINGMSANPSDDPLGQYLAATPGLHALVLESDPARAEIFRSFFSRSPLINIQDQSNMTSDMCGYPTSVSEIEAEARNEDSDAHLKDLDLGRLMAEQGFQDLSVLQVDAGPETIDLVMAQNFIAIRPKLILMPRLTSPIQHDKHAHNVFTNLGYQNFRIGDACIAVRRDCLDATLSEELRHIDAAHLNG